MKIAIARFSALILAISASTAGGFAAPATGAEADPSHSGWIAGMDISYWQGEATRIDWSEARTRNASFTYVKVSEGSYGGIATRYAAQREAASAHGLFTGPYHFANPNAAYASGAEQARLFAGYSAQWDAPGNAVWAPGEKLLPPMIDLEWNPYPEDGDDCYDLSPTAMVTWIHDFLDEATMLFGRRPVIYTSTSWWNLCTAGSTEFSDYPLSLARWAADKAGGPSTLPAGWSSWTFWQHGNDSTEYSPKLTRLPGDQQYFAGVTIARLAAFADESPR